MSTSPPNKDGQGGSPPWCQAPAAPSRTPSVSAAMSVPSLTLWSRKIALQSEELAALIQSCSTKLLSHQEQLEELLKNCKIDIANSKKEIEAVSKQRNDEVDTHLTTLRRLSQTISDILYALEAKLSLLDTLHTLHKKLQSHDLLFRELSTGQQRLLHDQDKLSTAQQTIAAKQGSQLQNILRTLDRIERGQCRIPQTQELAYEHETTVLSSTTGEDITVKDSQPALRSKRQRRLLSDDELLGEFSSGSGHRQISVELLPFEDTRRIREATVIESRERAVADAGGVGALSSERPLKRKLLSTMDVEQFTDDDF